MAVASLPHGGAADHGGADQLYIETRSLRLQGFLLFLISDCILFSSFIFAYLYMRNSGQGWPPPGIQHLDVAFASLNSVILFGSGATMHYALENWKHDNFNRYALFMLATIVLGACFLGGQAYEYNHLIFDEKVTWAGSGIFGASFFTLTGMHGFHVFGRRAVPDHSVFAIDQRRLYEDKFFGLTAGTLYWHFVDVIWVVLFSIFYLI